MKSEHKMWRTLVRVTKEPDQSGVLLIIPGWSTTIEIHCNYQAIPPDIFKNMRIEKRYHVECNIGARKAEDLCFDRWELE